ncbi:cytochrome P450 [Rhodococcus xishaensis]|nr:cytochrome P450 [Rhodococcus xishaensis]
MTVPVDSDTRIRQITLPDATAAWEISGYTTVRHLLADQRLSLNRKNSTAGYQGLSLPPALDANLLNMDPPEHTRIRKLVAAAFTARRTEALEPHVRSACRELLAELPVQADADGVVDLIPAFTNVIPSRAIADLLGVPAEDSADFSRWTTTLANDATADREAVKQAAVAIVVYLTELIAAKRSHPQDDLISDLIAARDHHDALTDDELLSLTFLLLGAGYENAANLLTNTLHAMLSSADLAAEITESLTRRGKIDDRLRETLIRRYDGLKHAIRRFPTTDIAVGDTTIPAGSTILLAIRETNARAHHHLSFGHGIHFCIGASLARLELAIALEEFLSTYPRARLADREISLRPSTRVHAPNTLPAVLV